jgi:hypothetical protein
MNVEPFLSHLKDVSSSPLGIFALVVTAVLWLWASYSKGRFSALRGLPPGKRASILTKEYGPMPKAGLTGEQWIRSRKHSLYLIAFLATLLIALIMFTIAAGHTVSEPGKSGRDEARPTPETTITTN